MSSIYMCNGFLMGCGYRPGQRAAWKEDRCQLGWSTVSSPRKGFAVARLYAFLYIIEFDSAVQIQATGVHHFCCYQSVHSKPTRGVNASFLLSDVSRLGARRQTSCR